MQPTLVDPACLEEQLGRRDLSILDCSITHAVDDDGKPAYLSGRAVWADGHIPGSQHVDLVQDLSDGDAKTSMMMPPVEQLRDALQAVGVADGQHIVLYDNNMTMWAARVWWMLQSVSLDAVVLNGGWRMWTRQGRPVETGDQRPAPVGELTLVPKPGYFVTKEEVLEQLGNESTCLIDALQSKVFRGEREDYQRPGHIPGAHNVPAVHLVDRETHKTLPLDDLRERFAGTTANTADRVITYCGAGVAASSAAFALGLLGISNVAVYDGSMTEWAVDPSLPLVTGER